MSEIYWKDDEDDFRDVPDEVNQGQSAPMPVINSGNVQKRPETKSQPVEPQYEPYIEEYVEEDIEEDYTAVLADADLRIDQGTLYKMVMNHNLFEGLDVDQRAIDNVQREIRRFAKDRMEIMLGMRQEAPKDAIVSSPFNDLEITILKKVASTASKGATESAEANKTAAVVKAAPKRETLNPIGSGSKVPQKPAPIAPKKAVQQLAGKPQAPIQRQAKEQSVPIPMDSPNYKPLDKPLSQMTEDEILKRNKEAEARQVGRKPVKSSSALPMPSMDQQEQMLMHRALDINPVNAIVSAINNSSKKRL